MLLSPIIGNVVEANSPHVMLPNGNMSKQLNNVSCSKLKDYRRFELDANPFKVLCLCFRTELKNTDCSENEVREKT